MRLGATRCKSVVLGANHKYMKQKWVTQLLLICTKYHRVTHFCLLYSWFAPNCTELHRVPPSYFIFNWYNSYLHWVPPSDSFLINILIYCTEYHRVAPSCTEYHRVNFFLIDILLTCTEYHWVTHFCLLYSWFAPKCTELHLIPPSYIIFNWYIS